MLTVVSLLCWLYLSSLTVALLPPPPSPGTDPCGPFNHIGDAGFNTCMSPVVTGGPDGPAPYKIVCGLDSGIEITIKTGYCAGSARNMCMDLVLGRLAPGQWHWTTDSSASPCRVGMFISSLDSAAPIPNFRRCLNQIYQPLVFSCVTSRHNIGTVNIQSLPDYTTNDTGMMVNPGYHAYIVSPVALFYDVGVTPGAWGDPRRGGVAFLLDPNKTRTDAAQAAYSAAHNAIVPAATAGQGSTSSA
ncbi:MAG: hypothetical protein Q9207_000935 [Kuettlingeria erythrocarpa]